jgi:Holliday junction resolvase RusA-like endonuclease
MPEPAVSFWIAGRQIPRGSKKPIPKFDRSGKWVGNIVVDSSDDHGGREWMSQVRDDAIRAWGDFRKPLDGPLTLQIDFIRIRPKGHFRTGRHSGTLRDDAPSHPIGWPDVLKLARAIEDCLSSVIYRDDAQIVTELLTKRYGSSYATHVQVFAEPENAVSLPDARQMNLFGR